MKNLEQPFIENDETNAHQKLKKNQTYKNNERVTNEFLCKTVVETRDHITANYQTHYGQARDDANNATGYTSC